jgi:predicted DNA-binding transcriptional regulator AlpA
MANARLLPHLATASRELLGDIEMRRIPVGVRIDVAQKAGVSQNTVDRFLKAETVPRSSDLDSMVTAVAEVAGRDWLDPWKAAIAHAEGAKADFAEFVGATDSAATDDSEEARAGRAVAAAKKARVETEKARGKSPGKQSPRATKRRAG